MSDVVVVESPAKAKTINAYLGRDYEVLASFGATLYFAAAIGGVGTGAVYGTCVGNALKWFPARRGMAAGVTSSLLPNR